MNGRTLARVIAVGSLFTGAAAWAQHADDYETGYNADADGEIITGQPADADNKFYIPVADSEDGLVVTYVDNVFGIPLNPSGGGANFVVSSGADPAQEPVPFARSQRDISYAAPGGKVKVAYDVLVTKLGDPVTNQNVGSFSAQLRPEGVDPTQFAFIDLAIWTDPNDATLGWSGSMVWFNEVGTQLNEGIAEFAGLSNDNWYRRSHSLDLETREMLKLAVVDLGTGDVLVHDADTRFARPEGDPLDEWPPTGFRYFAGCSTGNCSPGNTLAWDNLIVTCYEDIDENGGVDFPDVLALLTAWGDCPGGCVADLDRSGDVGFNDLLIVLTAWGDCM